MSDLVQRYRLFIVGSVIIAAATAVLLLLARDERFEVGGVSINPVARIKPERTYELIVWEEELVIPWAAKTQSEMLVDAIREFQSVWPNAAITYTLVDPDKARENLAAAVASGAPPDVYGTARGVVFHPRLQVPASPYLPGDEGPEVLGPVATGMLAENDTIWGWPRAMWWQTWLGRTSDRLQTEGRVPTMDLFWTWDEFQRWVREVSSRAPDGPGSTAHGTSRPQPVLALNGPDIVVLEQLMSNAGAPSYTDASGNLLWNESMLVDVASFLRGLQREGTLPDKEANPSRTRLEQLFNGEAALIGPVSPHLTQAVFRHTPDEFTLLPVPRRPGDEAVATLDVSAYFIFRHDAYEGDDHTRLAAELAAFLAAYSEKWLIESIGLLPVDADGWTVWHDSAPLDASSRALLQAYAERGQAPFTMRGRLQIERLRSAIVPHWHRFWSETMTNEQFAAATMAALQNALTPE